VEHLSRGPAPILRISHKADPYVSLPVWCLLLDGLKVAPFDRHPPGDGRLHAMGLDTARWEQWERRVLAQRVALEDAMDKALGRGCLAILPLPKRIPYPRELGNPKDAGGALVGSDALRDAVRRLAVQWSARPLPGVPSIDPDGVLYREFAGLQGRPDHLRIWYVGYPETVWTVAPPGEVVIGIPGDAPIPELQTALRQAVHELCSHAGPDQQ
jgi:hypothetical protein